MLKRRDGKEISEESLALLVLLAELEDADLIHREYTSFTQPGYGDGPLETGIGAVITNMGRDYVDAKRNVDGLERKPK